MVGNTHGVNKKQWYKLSDTLKSSYSLATILKNLGVDYTKLTAENFIISPTYYTMSCSGGSKVNEIKSENGNGAVSINITYTASTGNLTISGLSGAVNQQGGQAYCACNVNHTSGKLYCIIGE